MLPKFLEWIASNTTLVSEKTGIPHYSGMQKYTVNQKVCSSHQIKRESLVTIVTPKYGVMRTPHRLGVKYTPNLV